MQTLTRERQVQQSILNTWRLSTPKGIKCCWKNHTAHFSSYATSIE